MTRPCKDDEVVNPKTGRCIKINGSTFAKLDQSLLSKEDKEKVQKVMVKDEIELQAQACDGEFCEVDPNIDYELFEGFQECIVMFYNMCKMCGKIIFDGDGIRIGLAEYLDFQESYSGYSGNVLDAFFTLKHPTRNRNIDGYLEGFEIGNISLMDYAKGLLEVYVHYIIKGKFKSERIQHDIWKTKVVFTRIGENDGKLYYRQINSHEVGEEDAIVLSDIGLTKELVLESSLMRVCGLYNKGPKYQEVCRNKDDLFMFTNKFDVTTWCEVPDTEVIRLGSYAFSVSFLLEYMTNKLNSSNMNNPYPSYPVNPFTIEPLTRKQLKKIKKQVVLGKMKVPMVVKVFLEEEHLWDDDDNEMVGAEPYEILDVFEKRGLRFKRINCKDSQDNITGYWVRKDCPLSRFEIYFSKYNETMNNSYKHKMDRMPQERITFDDLEKRELEQ